MPKSKPPRKRSPGNSQARPLRAGGVGGTRFGERARGLSRHKPYGFSDFDSHRIKGGALLYLLSLYLPVLIFRGLVKGGRALWQCLQGY